MSLSSDLQRIDGIVKTAAYGLFSSHDVVLSIDDLDAPETAHEHDIAASIGFVGQVAQGAILMTTQKSVIARVWPRELRSREPSETEICDWAGELVNQLLGRVKNALVHLGQTLEQSTPTVVTGEQVHRAPAATNVARRYCCKTGGGTILIYFDAEVTDGFTLEERGTGSGLPAAEGEIHLF